MQWFIDLILEVVANIGYLTTAFVDRGDAFATDFDTAFWTKDGNWHTLDLSGIVPPTAKAVSFTIILNAVEVNRSIFFRTKGNTQSRNISQGITQGSLITTAQDLLVPVGPDGLAEYNIVLANWLNILMTVKGWWL